MFDADLRLVGWNRTFFTLLDFPMELARIGTPFADFMRLNAVRGEYGPGDVEALVEQRVNAARAFTRHYLERVRSSGQIIAVRGEPLPGNSGFATVYTDITEQRRIEHLIREHNEELERRVQERTADLKAANEQLIEANRIQAEISQALRRSLTENIEISTELPDETLCVNVDPNQLENALLNLALNARDAMPEGGRLEFTARPLAVGDSGWLGNEAAPGGPDSPCDHRQARSPRGGRARCAHRDPPPAHGPRLFRGRGGQRREGCENDRRDRGHPGAGHRRGDARRHERPGVGGTGAPEPARPAGGADQRLRRKHRGHGREAAGLPIAPEAIHSRGNREPYRRQSMTSTTDATEKHDTAILILTGRRDTSDRVAGLEVGADDYVVKPFEPRELVARVRSILRRYERAQSGESALPGTTARFGGLTFDPARNLLTGPDGEELMLSAAEARLLSRMLQAPNRILSRDYLLEGREATPYDRSIDVQISRLRHKIEVDPNDPQIIKTVYGAGYIFYANVEWA